MRARSTLGFCLLSSALLASCGSSPEDVSGSWNVNLTNGPNECMVSGWTEDESTSGIPLVITQDGADVTGTIGGAWGTAADVAFGTREFRGTVSGRHIDMRLTGRAGSMGGCAFTTVIDFDADTSGDTLAGRLVLSADTNSSPDCMHLATCMNVQAMNGARPPTR